MKSGKIHAANEFYALAFGLFLGLCILKFGDPVILDQKISPPHSLSEAFQYSWPTHWANWILWPLAIIGAFLIVPRIRLLPCPLWLLVLPLPWLGWQIVSATQSVDSFLTATALWQFFGCVASYFIGLFLFKTPRAFHLLLIGVMTAFTICLIRAIQQKSEFPASQHALLEGQRTGWTNFPPAMIVEMKQDQTIIATNGMDVVNPAIMAKFAKGRVMGTMVYPNALAGLILLLFPVSLVLAFSGAKKLRPLVRGPAIFLALALGLAAFFWSGSKFGWLIAMAIGGLCLFRLNWPVKLKILAVVAVAIVGLGAFAIRFHSYFEHGATSATARLDYWRAAVQITRSHPLFGTGPGTFQRPYAVIKSPDAEMARLAHNDYLEQFCDSGLPGGLFYVIWIAATLVFAGRKLWTSRDSVIVATGLGLFAWFIQGLGEFELYIPALAWTAFALLGYLIARAESVRQKPAAR